jgi:hypothetical protein
MYDTPVSVSDTEAVPRRRLTWLHIFHGTGPAS